MSTGLILSEIITIDNGRIILNLAPQDAATLADAIRTAVRLSAAENANHSALLRLEAARLENGRLIDLYTGGLITKEEFATRRAGYADEIARLENETASHPARVLADEETIQAAIAQIGNLRLADPLLQKSVLQNIFARIELRDGQISAVTPHPWAASFFDFCRLWAGLDSGVQSDKITLPAWLRL